MMDRSSKALSGLLFAGLSLLPCVGAAEQPAPAAPEAVPQTVAEPVPPTADGETPPPPAPKPAETPRVTQPAPATAPSKAAATEVPQPPSDGGEVDLIGDKPEAVAAAKPKPLMEDLTPSGPLNKKALRCYGLLGEIKAHVESISRDLDHNGKEITRLIKTSDALSKKITALADLWGDDDSFRDICGTAKRDALKLNDELSQVPRAWSHVRWSYNDMLTDTRKIRLVARDMAEQEAKPILLVGKDGKPVLDKDGKEVYTEPPPPNINPAIAKRDYRKAEAEAVRAQLRRAEEARKNPALDTEIPKGE
jgi:hypothetical protein